MTPNIGSFRDEITKIAAAQKPKPASKKRIGRALKGGAAIALGTGAGMATGNLLAGLADPKLMKLGPKGRKAVIIASGALGALGALGRKQIAKKFSDYVEDVKK